MSNSDRQGKGSGEKAVERNTSRPKENWSGAGGGSSQTKDPKVENIRKDVNDQVKKAGR